MPRPEDFPTETPEHCTKAYNEPCLLHPVNCPECINRETCQMKADMQRHPEIFKSCRHFRKGPARQIQLVGSEPTSQSTPTPAITADRPILPGID